MEQFQIDKQKALAAYDKADKNGKSLLEAIFGKESFAKKIMDLVKTFEDAIQMVEVDKDIQELLAYKGKSKHMLSLQAEAKLHIVIQALNKGWVPDWDNSNEYKYYPYFNMSGSGLSFGDCDYVSSLSFVGSRLCYKSRELAEYGAKQFADLYKACYKG